MWEQKDTGSGIHGVNRTFTWSASGTAEDGTAFMLFLDTLNNKCDGDETTPCTRNRNCRGIGNGKCGHAGFRNWRMPNVKELQSIVDYGVFAPAIDATFPGETTAASYWSSTSDAFDPPFAWFVDFSSGLVGPDGKGVTLRVRAVRGGR